MVNAEGIERTERQINDALAKGATLLCGGQRPDRPELKRGFFYEPTAVTHVRDDMLVLREETFGPLVAIATFEGVEEALRLANSTDYGLVTYAYTNDISTILRFAEGMESGTVAFNTVSPELALCALSSLEAERPGSGAGPLWHRRILAGETRLDRIQGVNSRFATFRSPRRYNNCKRSC